MISKVSCANTVNGAGRVPGFSSSMATVASSSVSISVTRASSIVTLKN